MVWFSSIRNDVPTKCSREVPHVGINQQLLELLPFVKKNLKTVC